MGLFRKRPKNHPKVSIETRTFHYDRIWSTSMVYHDREVRIIMPAGDTLDLAILPSAERMIERLDEHVERALSFAQETVPWPEGYRAPKLEQIVIAEMNSFVLQFDIEPCLPPISLEVTFKGREPVEAWWEYV